VNDRVARLGAEEPRDGTSRAPPPGARTDSGEGQPERAGAGWRAAVPTPTTVVLAAGAAQGAPCSGLGLYRVSLTTTICEMHHLRRFNRLP
jgi:hypothetical protein